jgi:hypothetical protein
MSNSEEKAREAREYVTLPFRLRQLALDRVKIFEDLFDQVAEALRTGHRRNEIAADVAECKEALTRALEEAAEWEYQARVGRQALQVMELYRDLTAEAALALVDSTILELAIAPTE